jgi:hypothetical protein
MLRTRCTRFRAEHIRPEHVQFDGAGLLDTHKAYVNQPRNRRELDAMLYEGCMRAWHIAALLTRTQVLAASGLYYWGIIWQRHINFS